MQYLDWLSVQELKRLHAKQLVHGNLSRQSVLCGLGEENTVVFQLDEWRRPATGRQSLFLLELRCYQNKEVSGVPHTDANTSAY